MEKRSIVTGKRPANLLEFPVSYSNGCGGTWYDDGRGEKLEMRRPDRDVFPPHSAHTTDGPNPWMDPTHGWAQPTDGPNPWMDPTDGWIHPTSNSGFTYTNVNYTESIYELPRGHLADINRDIAGSPEKSVQ